MRQRGVSAALEAVVLLPLLILIVGAIMMVARLELARQSVDAAAAAGARAASLERSPARGESEGEQAARRALAEAGVECLSSRVVVDAGELTRPAGASGHTRVEVACHVSLADVGVPGAPGAKTLVGEASSPIDPYRGR